MYVTLSAYGHTGPWRERRGFETLIQSATGMTHEHGFGGGLDHPEHLPAQVVDHGAGYLAALGALIALARRAREGGSYLVRVSLAQTGRWSTRSVAWKVGARLSCRQKFQDLMVDSDTPFGRLRHVLPAARLSETPGFWSRPHGCTWNTRGGVAYIGQTVQSRAHVDKPLHIKNAI